MIDEFNVQVSIINPRAAAENAQKWQSIETATVISFVTI